MDIIEIQGVSLIAQRNLCVFIVHELNIHTFTLQTNFLKLLLSCKNGRK